MRKGRRKRPGDRRPRLSRRALCAEALVEGNGFYSPILARGMVVQRGF
jgi:hypothetical protein